MNEFSVVEDRVAGVTERGVAEIAVDPKDVRSFLAEGDVFVGNLTVASGIRIAGRLEGSLEAKAGVVVIDRAGSVTGGITGTGGIFIDGHVGSEGDSAQVEIVSPGTITLMNNCVVNGNISYGKLATLGDMTHNGSSKKIRNT